MTDRQTDGQTDDTVTISPLQLRWQGDNKRTSFPHLYKEERKEFENHEFISEVPSVLCMVYGFGVL